MNATPKTDCPTCEDAQEAMESKVESSRQPVPNDNRIGGFITCVQCVREAEALREKGEHVSHKNYARVEVGFTREGLQVWCLRHDCNILHVDFQGQKHPASTRARCDFVFEAHNFTGGDNFGRLVKDALDILGPEYHMTLAKEIEVIPATILRWASNDAIPLVGLQTIVISKLRAAVEKKRIGGP